ncbi:uncharacterized protein BO66DRAFT_395056 [Aspergillus aculeatinus CBS 121060]|uniref:Uncharacterized protein n=1 Tax=Aspergillus aculeatinus CBS 121060 TaxID=1448322 RepID=A0ACD1GWF7_9EURO|nr:hypothetical protein BO66DRAFT_395056 [Aspergillus aculeatinus CBS 121060]RAH65805.1 hypothetical protein BO66DRAFT_395056 [Aspergillus aculeatinus CBS 121060]
MYGVPTGLLFVLPPESRNLSPPQSPPSAPVGSRTKHTHNQQERLGKSTHFSDVSRTRPDLRR